MKVARLAVRAENPIRGCEQQSCDADGPAVMITDHVLAVRFPLGHAGDHVATAVPARGCVEDGRDPDPAPPGRGPAAAAAAPPEAELGGPGRARGIGRRDTQSAPPGAAAAGHPGHERALAPRHRPAPLGGAVHARQDRPAGPARISGPWSSGWPGRTPNGATAGSTGSWSAWESRSRRRPSGRSSRPAASAPRRGGPGLPGRGQDAISRLRERVARGSALHSGNWRR